MKRSRLSRRFLRSNQFFLVPALLLISLSAVIRAQSQADPVKATAEPAPSTADPAKFAEALQTRIERARALVAAHQLETAATELESVRATATEDMFRNITSVMLMNIYLEEGNYTRAQALLEESFGSRSAKGDESIGNYFALAGQAVNGARTHLTRYRTLGVNTSDLNLPVEALNDLNRLRSFLDRMIRQAKEISGARRGFDSLSLLEDVLGIRLSLATDAEDQAKWESEYAAVRERLASSHTQIASLGGAPTLPSPKASPGAIGTNLEKPAPKINPAEKRTSTVAVKDSANQRDADTPRRPEADGEKNGTAQPAVNEQKQDEQPPVERGSLNAKATKRVLPGYPIVAKQTRTTGFVRVHVVVDKTGKVIEVSRSEGPMLLRKAAEDAARRWFFDVSHEGRATRYSGFIDFNFTL